jgi:capsular exopolysaccharide synthesis family protein
MPFSELCSVLWRRKVIVGLVTLSFVVLTSAFVLTQETVYEARATVALLPDGDTPELVPFYGQAVESLLPTYARLIESRAFLDGVARDLPFTASGATLGDAVFSDPFPGTGVLEVVSRSSSPVRAQAMAQGVADAFVTELDANGIVRLRVIDQARVPETPQSPGAASVLGVAGVVGLALGAGAAVAWDRRFGRVRGTHELAEASGLTVLGVLPEEAQLREVRRIVVGDEGFFDLEEKLRELRTNLLFAVRRRQQGAVMITGLNPQDGKSTVAANLAVIVAELGFSVLLIDGDIHRPVQHELFGLPNDLGLTSSLLEGAEPSSIPQSTKYANLRVVTAGQSIDGRAQELTLYLQQLPRFNTLAEIVLIDSPPLRAADDVRLLAAFSGAVVLLVRAGASSPQQVREAVDSLEMLEAKLLGTVLTMAPTDAATVASEYYRYRRGSEGGGEESASREAPGRFEPR